MQVACDNMILLKNVHAINSDLSRVKIALESEILHPILPPLMTSPMNYQSSQLSCPSMHGVSSSLKEESSVDSLLLRGWACLNYVHNGGVASSRSLTAFRLGRLVRVFWRALGSMLECLLIMGPLWVMKSWTVF